MVDGTNYYISQNEYSTEELRVDVNLINVSNELDIEALKSWQPEYKDAEFILEEGKYIVGREVEKMSKRWYNVVNPDAICEEYGADSLRLYEMRRRWPLAGGGDRLRSCGVHRRRAGAGHGGYRLA